MNSQNVRTESYAKINVISIFFELRKQRPGRVMPIK
jgi:hypothetical protein